MTIHLRQKKQGKDGKISLYLEIYKGTTKTADGKVKGVRDYEFLNLYLLDKPRSPSDKQQNKDNLKLAQSIRAQRELEIKNGQYGFTSGIKQSTNFIEYFTNQKEKRSKIEGKEGNYGNWNAAVKHFVRFAGTQITFKEIDKKFCEGFRVYLTEKAKTKSKKNLSSSAVSSYFNKFRACLNTAVDDEIIIRNPASLVSIPKVVESKREYLTLDELKELVKTECRYDILKRAFIFSCLTGLRWSDIQKLTWSEVQYFDNRGRVVLHQQKTKGLQYIDISEQARGYMGEMGNPDERVFTGLRYSDYMNVALQRWVMASGCTKLITFHCARHTFAVLQLTLGTEIYTLSKLLGHSELKTTQIYAKIVDEKKREAMNIIPNLTI